MGLIRKKVGGVKMMHISDKDKKRIEEAVRKVERECHAEVVPLLVGQSDNYPGARWRLAVTFSLSVSFLALLFFKEVSPLFLLISQFFTLWLGHWVGFPFLLRFFLARYKTDEEVHQRALKAFWENRMHQTHNRTGILIMLSHLERRAEILCDIGINKKVDQKDWDQILHSLLKAVRGGTLIEGLETSILACGKLVQKHFPQEEGTEQRNELSDKFLILKT